MGVNCKLFDISKKNRSIRYIFLHVEGNTRDIFCFFAVYTKPTVPQQFEGQVGIIGRNYIRTLYLQR